MDFLILKLFEIRNMDLKIREIIKIFYELFHKVIL